MKKIMLLFFVCTFAAATFAQEKPNTISEKAQNESLETEKIQKISKVNQNNATNTVVDYDFTKLGAWTPEGGPDPMVQVGTDDEGDPIWAMIAGDANNSGTVNTTDYLVVKPQVGQSGYLDSDVNLSGTVNTTDYLIIKPNVGKSSQVTSN